MSDHAANPSHGHAEHDGTHDHHHVTPFWTMFWVFVILIVLTLLTVWSSNIHFIGVGNSAIELDGNLHIIMALVIAAVKATLVGAFFMHLLYDKAINTVVVAATMFAVVLFIGLTLFDLAQRDAVYAEEGGGAFVNHPEVRQLTEVSATDAAGSIFPGGNLNLFAGAPRNEASFKFGKPKASLSIVEYVRQSAEAQAGNPDESHSEDGHADDHAEDGSGDHSEQSADHATDQEHAGGSGDSHGSGESGEQR